MSTNVGAVDFQLLLNSNPFNQGLKNAGNSIKSSGIESSLNKIGKLAITAFSVRAIVNFGKECLKLGSDLAEVQNVVDVTFGNLNTEVNNFAQNAIEQFGLGQTVTKKYVGTFGAMAKAFNFSNKEALEMSKTLTGLSGDVASFYNLTSDEAYTKLKSVFTGETETLKDLGVVMTQNALDQYALANGYSKTTAKMTEQEKVALRYKFVLDKLSLANGDFARTSDSWANQTRVLSLRFNELKATLGQGFINIFTPIVKGINWVLSKLQVLANAFKSFTEIIFGNAGGDGNTSSVSNLAVDATNASEAIGGIGESAKKSAKDMKNLASFDTANVLKNNEDSGSGSGGGAGGSIDTGGLNLADNIKQQASDIENILNGVNFEPLKQSFNNLKEAISYFGQGCGKILDGFYNNYLKPLGNYIISDALPHFLNSTANAMKSIDFDKLKTAFDELWKTLEPFTENIGNGLLWFYDNVLLPLGLWTINDVLPGFLNILTGALKVVNQTITDIQPIWQWFWDNVLSPIVTWTGGVIVDVLNGIGEALNWIGEHEVAVTILESLAIAIGLVTIATNASTIATTAFSIISGIASGAATLLASAISFLTSPITLVVLGITALIAIIITCIKNWDKIKETAQKCWEGIKNAWNSAGQWFNQKIITPIKNFFSNLWNNVKSTASNAWNGIKNIFSGTGSWFSNKFQQAYNGITRVFSNIGSFFSGVWNRIRSTFSSLGSSIGNAISNAVKSGINGVISMIERTINRAISLINGGINLINQIPGVSVGRIGSLSLPRLAQGGYVKANTPQLAMIGDNRHQGEVVAPEDKLMSLYKKANEEMGLGNDSKVIQLLEMIIQILTNMSFDFNLYIDSYEMNKRLEKIKNKNKFATNGG